MPNMSSKSRKESLLAAIFLMATSAIGPGFITQTATFTSLLGASFAFAILISIIIDFIIQLNIWRVVSITNMRASDIANAAIPGSGYLLAILVIIGGLFFNIGNIGGAGLGLNILFGLDPKVGGTISALFAIAIFLSKRAGMAMDKFIILAGIVMILLTLYVAFSSNPPVLTALHQTFLPEKINFATITTIVGGTVGGYITYSGAHRLLDKGMVGVSNIKAVNKAALTGVALTGIMRYILFIAIFGVVASGIVLDTVSKSANPAAQAFQAAAGEIGFKIFGIIFWSAALTSVIGAAYTSVSFINSFKKGLSERSKNIATVIFIAISLISYIFITTPPAAMLVFVGGLNGLILPLGFSIFLFAMWKRKDLMGDYKYPLVLFYLGVLVCILTWYMGIQSIGAIFKIINL
ncbi:NRAMP family divalent metal transporter [Helicobacter sp. 13S00401-1]|uniref:NRAMP family divalent metal transporter n=1 Tax=Helicobacter sp. 13S00401-1 TaxID=1905758 RepID=UPI00209C6CF9|nr:NRAMP family divalent metal transporter [Helicobacter sp. 13S00401-1]